MTEHLFEVSYDKEFKDFLFAMKEKYPKEIFELEGIGSQLDIVKFSKEFFTKNTASDVSVDENANVSSNCMITYKKEASKPMFKLNSLYILWKMLRKTYNTTTANEILEKQLNGEIYMHDSWMVIQSYCFNYSCLDIINKGLPVIDSITSFPPKHFMSFKEQVTQFVAVASNSTLGATGLADLLICSSYYVNKILKTGKDSNFSFSSEDDIWNYVKETLTSLIYTLNQRLRASQTPFTNVSIYDENFLKESQKMYVFPDGSNPDIEVVKKIQEIFLNIINEELERTVFTYPVITACFSVDSENNILDEDFLHFVAEQNQKYGFINIYIGKTSTISGCCRLRSDRENDYFNSIGGSSTKIGSLGVCTINLPRAAYTSKSEEEFLDKIETLAQITGKLNNIKRKIIKQKINEGKQPLYSHGFIDINKQYSTLGINGMYEALLKLGYDITTKEGQDFAKKMCNILNNVVDNMEKKYQAPHNMEQIPAEGASPKLAKKDIILGIQNEYTIYSNQFIPLTATANLLDRINIQGQLDKEFSGGSILHLNVDKQVDVEKLKKLIRFSAKNGVVYFAINYQLNKCSNGHITIGKDKVCSVCGDTELDSYSRVVGFLVPIRSMGKERRENEYPDRKFYESISVGE